MHGSSRVNGQRAVGLGIKKQRGANAVEIAERVRAKMKEVVPTLPKGMTLGVNFDSTIFIKDSVRELTHHLVLAAILTSLVCWLFLGSWSSTLNVLLAIPTSVLGTFIVTYFLGFTLNAFTLLGLTLSIGIVVDDAIMVLENIVRHRELGQDKLTAAVFGAREISFAAAAAMRRHSRHLPAGRLHEGHHRKVLLPVRRDDLRRGQFLPPRSPDLGADAVLAVPPDQSPEQAGPVHGRGVREDERSVPPRADVDARPPVEDRRTRDRVFALSIASVTRIRKEFVPAQDQAMFLVSMETPVGSSFEYTDVKFKSAEEWLMKEPILDRYYSAVGGFDGSSVNSGMLFVTLKNLKDRPLDAAGRPMSQAEIMDAARTALNKIPSLKAFIIDLSQGGYSAGRNFPVEFTVRGPDWDTLTKVSDDFRHLLEKGGDLRDVDTDYRTGMPEVRVYPDRDKAYARGVSVQSIGTTINAMVGGVRQGLFTDNGRRYDVRVRAEPRYRLEPDDIKKFYVRNNRGEVIRLSDVVELQTVPSLLAITRKDRERAISIYANVVPGKSQSQVLSDIEALAKKTMPEGYHIVLSGSSQTFKESFQSLVFALLLGILVAYMVLGAQFNSFVHPFTVLLALPFSVSGAFLALWAFDKSLNVNSMIGLLLLMGLVKKNSIMLVDFTNQRRDEGLSRRAALIDACPTRLRPIVMTSVATIAAAVPSALARGAGSEATSPMALALIGGVTVSTFLTLFIVPAAYSLLVAVESGKSAETSLAVLRAVREAEKDRFRPDGRQVIGGALSFELPEALRSLRRRDYRLYFTGQFVSMVGTWMQVTAQSWLVYRLTGSGALLGLVAAAGRAPSLLLGLAGGAAADRFDRRSMLVATQVLSLLQAAVLAWLTLTGRVQVWHVFVLSVLLGIVNVFDMPARQAFVPQLVPREEMGNAIALSGILLNLSRLIGPAAAGILIARSGEASCFVLNAVSYVAVVISLLMIRAKPVEARVGSAGELARIRAGLRYCFEDPSAARSCSCSPRSASRACRR